ncbi:MAG TPA: peptidoglycan editing factor PgeF [Polyangiaceae bacterium]|nr:peptidoglycan editing factor PgeF [Polyangiaceae bacterium]
MTAEYLKSPLLSREGFQHAFFTRRGGQSPAPFDSLHFGTAGQSADDLVANVRSAAEALRVDPARLYTATQVHGRDVIVVHGTEERNELLRRRADALVSTVPAIACGIKVADCVPLLIADRVSGAVAAIHSGWQGTELNVVAASLTALRGVLGAPGDLLAAIGPHIEVCCFEVGDDVAERLRSCAPQADAIDRRRGPRAHVDLRKIVREQLSSLGLRHEAIEDVGGCTKCDKARFFSYRRDRDSSGRMLAAIAVRSS